jgi:hypothetical protein
MRTRTILAILSASLAVLSGCNRGPNLDVRTFHLDYRSSAEASQLIAPYVYSDRETNPGAMSGTEDAISVRETPDNLDKIARVLEEFDQPIPDLRLRFQLIEADSFEGNDAAIAEVTDQLRSLFQFKGYRLLGEALVAVAGETWDQQETSQRFLGTSETFQVDVSARVQRPGVVRLDPIRLWRGGSDVMLETSVTVNAGQTLVIGGSKAREGERSYILTVTAEPEQ